VRASVLVPVLNEGTHIRETVAAMRQQHLDGEIEFLFMDGGSTDETRPILEGLAERDPRIRVLDNPGRTTPHALNVGLRAARGNYVVRMDAHSYYPPTYVADGIERLEQGGVVWVAGPAIPRGEGRWSRRVALALNAGLGAAGGAKWTANNGSAPAEVNLDTGVFAGVWRRVTLEELGGWAEGWPINQDSEMAARVLEGGGRIVMLPSMGAEYVPRNSLQGLARQYLRYGFYRAKTARHHANSMRRAHVMAPALVLALPFAVTGPLRRPARALLAAYFAALVRAGVKAAEPGRPADAAAVPVVSAVMHLSWGAGFVASSVYHGPPVAAIVRLARPGGGR
jgi:glycosyltransferase involved in cell wall biosynthesis